MEKDDEAQGDEAAHVVLEGETFVCHHCGQRYRMNLPCPVSLFAVAAAEYSRMHRHCEKRS